MNKRKQHQFLITVETFDSRRRAELALLSAFARRNPDGCEFHLRRKKPKSL